MSLIAAREIKGAAQNPLFICCVCGPISQNATIRSKNGYTDDSSSRVDPSCSAQLQTGRIIGQIFAIIRRSRYHALQPPSGVGRFYLKISRLMICVVQQQQQLMIISEKRALSKNTEPQINDPLFPLGGRLEQIRPIGR
jgi:hypothetical protein